MQFLFPPKYVSLISKKRGCKKDFDDFAFLKIGRILIDPLKGAAPLSGGIGYSVCAFQSLRNANARNHYETTLNEKYRTGYHNLI